MARCDYCCRDKGYRRTCEDCGRKVCLGCEKLKGCFCHHWIPINTDIVPSVAKQIEVRQNEVKNHRVVKDWF